ncbi:MAG: PEP/pyruvate-binding domain-containing protein [Hespellia sp.]|nr:PEP/pyruvate-binding domain-containing protein [Hespellia sp.]
MIRNFNSIRVNEVDIVGGKGANLGEMTHAGISVPEGFVITSDAYRLFLNENGLYEWLKAALRSAGRDETKLLECAKNFREKILQSRIPTALEAQITDQYQQLGEQTRVAVRSSATAEDLADASFAGQQETYLNVIGTEEVLKQVQNCYASLWGNRAVIYRKNQGYDQSSVALAVVIQRMIESEVAGVLFTVNPVTGDENQMQINASYGLGESVVSGRVTADSYVCDKNGRLITCTQGSKKTQIIYEVGSSGTREVKVEEEKQKQRVLDDGMLADLCREGLRIEQYYKKPMDIEWGICNNKIYILQARAITTLHKAPSGEEEKRIQDYLKRCKCSGLQRKNMSFLLEKMPYVFYPFDYELIETIDDQKSNIFSEGGVIMDMQPQIDDDGIMILPSSGIGVNRNLKYLPSLLKEIKDIEGCRVKLQKQMEHFRKELLDIQNTDYDNLTLAKCGELYPYFLDYVRRLTYCRFKYALFPSALCKIKLEKALRKINTKLTAYDLYQNLDYETAVMSRDLKRLAAKARKDKAVTAAIQEGMHYEAICTAFPQMKEAFAEFLKKHGFKTDFNCYCITAHSFYEDPDRMVKVIRPLLDGDKEQESEENSSFDVLMKQLEAAVGAKEYKGLRKIIDTFRYMHLIREESQLMWETCFYYTKKLLKRTSLLLCGHDDYMQEFSYLFLSELTKVCQRGTLNEMDQEKIKRRKKMHPLAETVWEQAKLKVFPDTGDTLRGVSGSAGETIGKVCLIHGPEEFYKFQKGDVLVCRLTDPEWTPLFTLASAVVADTGAALSHAAIVAREYGIPAVLGVGHATTRYHNGDMIHVNGTKGEVSKVG